MAYPVKSCTCDTYIVLVGTHLSSYLLDQPVKTPASSARYRAWRPNNTDLDSHLHNPICIGLVNDYDEECF